MKIAKIKKVFTDQDARNAASIEATGKNLSEVEQARLSFGKRPWRPPQRVSKPLIGASASNRRKKTPPFLCSFCIRISGV